MNIFSFTRLLCEPSKVEMPQPTIDIQDRFVELVLATSYNVLLAIVILLILLFLNTSVLYIFFIVSGCQNFIHSINETWY